MFGKKKKNETPPESLPAEDKTKGGKTRGGNRKNGKEALLPATVSPEESGKKKWKFIPGKLAISRKIVVLLVLFLLISAGVAGFVVYRIYSAKKSATTSEPVAVKRVYVEKKLPNIIISSEVVRFTYDFMPEFYDLLVIVNSEIDLVDNEIKRLADLGKQFPEHIKIAEKEMKIWEKEKNKLKQTYEKLEKKVEALYVGYRVNQETGNQQVQEQKNEIAASAKDALAPVLELTRRIHAVSEAEQKEPEGFVQRILYKAKQKTGALWQKISDLLK